MGRRESEHRKKKRESELIRSIAHRNWNIRELLGRLLKEADIGDLVTLHCTDKHSTYVIEEGRVLHKYGSRLEMREDMERPDGLLIAYENRIELVPYYALRKYEILTLKTPKVMGGGRD